MNCSRFDVAGAGACLTRYSDPSFFKAESAFAAIAPLEVQREKKARKVKVLKKTERICLDFFFGSYTSFMAEIER